MDETRETDRQELSRRVKRLERMWAEQGSNAPADLGQTPMQTAQPKGYRESARGVLEGKIKLHRHTADRLEALAKALPQELPPDADSALWELLMSSRP